MRTTNTKETHMSSRCLYKLNGIGIRGTETRQMVNRLEMCSSPDDAWKQLLEIVENHEFAPLVAVCSITMNELRGVQKPDTRMYTQYIVDGKAKYIRSEIT